MSFDGWPVVKLGDVAQVKGGKRLPKETPYTGYKTDHPYVRLVDIHNGRISAQSIQYIDEETYCSISRYTVDAGDICLAIVGNTIGMVFYVDEIWSGANLTENAARLTNLKDADSRYIYFYLTSKNGQEEIFKNAVGSAQGKLPIYGIQNIDLPLPPLSIQRRIADILSALDDKIELNRQTNATLEAMAQAIFKEWFVDFNYPGATGELVDSELGLIPAGWRISTFEEELDAARGLSYRGDGLEDKDAVPMHNLNSVYEGGGYKFEGIKYYSGDYKEKHIVKPGDLIIANTEQGHKYLLIGYPAIVPDLFGEQGIYSHHIYRVRSKLHSYLTSDFLYFLLLLPEIRDQVTGFANGTTVNMLKIEGLQKPRFVLPPEELVKRFGEIAQNIRLQKEEMIKQSTALAQIRDALLPKLMRGEIEV